MRRQQLAVTAVAVSSALMLAGCTGGDSGQESGTLTIWTIEDVADRVTAQEAMYARFTEQTGIEIEFVPVSEDQLTTVLTSAAASDDLPDAIGAIDLTSVYNFNNDGLLDTDAAAAVIDALGADTFSQRALELVTSEGEPLAVPSDGWAQLLYYRADLFEAAGLEPPTTFDQIEAAAAALDSDSLAGITLATAPGDTFTQQTFEHFALANGCELVSDDGEVAIDTPECVGALEFGRDLAANYSVAGNQDVDTTRATYFAGGAAMVVWSSFLLDELAGLRNDALPTCPECEADPGFLAANTGVVSAIQGPDAEEPASFGAITSWVILDGASPDTTGFVEWMMSESYVDWLGIAPEGKVPTRFGTADNPTEYSDAWNALEAGVDTKAALSSIYPAEVLEAVVEAPNGFSMWGIPQGQGPLAGAVAGQLVFPRIISDMLNSDLSPQDAAERGQDEVVTIQEDLGF